MFYPPEPGVATALSNRFVLLLKTNLFVLTQIDCVKTQSILCLNRHKMVIDNIWLLTLGQKCHAAHTLCCGSADHSVRRPATPKTPPRWRGLVYAVQPIALAKPSLLAIPAKAPVCKGESHFGRKFSSPNFSKHPTISVS